MIISFSELFLILFFCGLVLSIFYPLILLLYTDTSCESVFNRVHIILGISYVFMFIAFLLNMFNL